MAIEPVTREERFLAAAGGRSVTPPTPITRKEQLLQGIIDAVKSGGATPDVIVGAVNDYLNANPVQPGATTEQAAQIEQNKTDIADLQTEVDELKESGGNGSGQNVNLTAVQINALDGMFRVCAFAQPDVSAQYNAFRAAFHLDGAVAVPATGITLSESALAFSADESRTLIATVQPSNTTDTVVWTSSNNSVVTVVGGVVTPISNGSCIIRATAGSVSAECAVTVDIAESAPTVRKTYLYHFDGNLVSGGDHTLGLSANAPAYTDDAKFGQAVAVSSADTVVSAVGIPADDAPVLDGDFTISFWGKIASGNKGYFLFASKYISADAATLYPAEIVGGFNGQKYHSANFKYAGVALFYENGYMRVRLHNAKFTHALTAGISVSLKTDWHHFALCRKNGVLMLFYDGKMAITANIEDAIYFPDQIAIGCGFLETGADTAATLNTANISNVCVDELLIDDAVCLYTADFTVPDAPYSEQGEEG